MRVTQQDIARLAQVSQATVSRVLAGDERVESDIRDRVRQVMREHNYQPDVRARSLRQKRTHLIGLVLKRELGTLEGDPFFALMVSEIVECLAGSPYHLCVEIATDEARQRYVYDDLLRTRRVDGLILVESEPSDERINRLQEDRFPFVLIGNAGGNPDLLATDNDNTVAAEIATKHLFEAGYRRPAMLAGPHGLTVTQDRVAGYQCAMDRAGLAPFVRHSGFGMDAAREAADKLFAEGGDFDSMVVFDDFMAMGVLQAARKHQISVPKQLGVVSFNNSLLCGIVDGGLSSVNLQIDKMVRWSVDRLLEVIEEKPMQGANQVTFPCELVARGTTTRAPLVEVL